MIKANHHLIKPVLGWLLGIGLGLLPQASLASALPTEVTINGVEFVLIPEGWFYKTGGVGIDGTPPVFRDEAGGGNIKIWLDSYYIAKFEARARDLVDYLNSPQGRNAVYDISEENCSIKQSFFGKFQLKRPEKDYPATHLSWTLANEWANGMGFRLPTESEWEKAARGSDQRLYPWGDDFPDDTLAGFGVESRCFTWPVDTFKKGRSPYGVYNMAGNVREFVDDWYNEEFDRSLIDGMKNPVSPKVGSSVNNAPSEGDAGPWKILKGGRWAAGFKGIQISARIYYTQDNDFRCNGTRFALDAATVQEHLQRGTATITRQ